MYPESFPQNWIQPMKTIVCEYKALWKSTEFNKFFKQRTNRSNYTKQTNKIHLIPNSKPQMRKKHLSCTIEHLLMRKAEAKTVVNSLYVFNTSFLDFVE